MREQESGKSVLLVEDDPLTRGAMRMVLEWEGYRVCCAANGQEALDLLHQGERPSLILLDIAMPVLDGRQFRAEQEKDPALAQIPVIVVSGTAVAATVEAAGHIQKPFLPGELLEAIRETERRC
jgi:CheY-like chemotaxis protein